MISKLLISIRSSVSEVYKSVKFVGWWVEFQGLAQLDRVKKYSTTVLLLWVVLEVGFYGLKRNLIKTIRGTPAIIWFNWLHVGEARRFVAFISLYAFGLAIRRRRLFITHVVLYRIP